MSVGSYKGLKPPNVFEDEASAAGALSGRVPPHLDPARASLSASLEAGELPAAMPAILSEEAEATPAAAPRKPGAGDIVIPLWKPIETPEGPLAELRLRPVTLGDAADWEAAPPTTLDVLAALSGRTVDELRRIEFPDAAIVLAILGRRVPAGLLAE